MSPQPITLGARYLFPVEGTPIRDGLITIRGETILELGPRTGRGVDIDLGNVAITPGFANAHTHLELGPILVPPGHQTEDQVDWLGRVIDLRRNSDPADGPTTFDANLNATVRAGTTLVADICTSPLSWNRLADAPIRGTVFAEILGLRRARGLQTSQDAWDWLGPIAPAPSNDPVRRRLRPGISPHAPYSTAEWLYHKAAQSQLPLTTHLAELPEELELLRTRGGRLRDFLETLGAWDDEWEPLGKAPAEYVRRGDLRKADWIVAHGTYLTPDDYWQLRPEAAPTNQRVAVAFCPRTHARFGHATHPYRSMLERGVVVCIGTDSLASSPSLGVLDEIRYLHRRDGSLSGELLLTMATLFGAWALRVEHQVGSLKPGKMADLAVIRLPDRDDPDPYRLLLESDEPVLATFFEGRTVHGPWRIG